ncbi:Stk1 family PASTA domain-containing Ser/Thr kinase [Mesobacillus selenatarsenatis]|uniref:Serine/threonine-protein kinase PrkC n=1 Tax=Mesobacillus selenatarsenatis (strain DSM 18680 / JCM 14380 / FERM P-15431 / SF-1) TaxID=1321606 RepID=A0A0A8X2I0_MESS1|nr:Stk1 family PASTA domain-containing Ser/Thr kinase [Mesobacillus selenatarsenatis]GAM14200.1 serine/threonine protein kinase PrkC, regulator of stationary phase [Mesobacillus selenatarsenatis SF-1]
MIIGKRISGRYKIKDMIGGGGMANVYLAHDMILDRDVAVKMLRLDFANDEEFIRRFHREAQSATSLAHPNIVSIYDVGEEDGLYYIVMEYVDGQTLKQYIQQHAPVPVEEALDIMKQLTSAISDAHHNHIVHRDIKPHNILIDSSGTVKITDFGIAMALSATSITQTNSVLGSVHYLSPEQARGGMANKKSDIYSIGIVMFELLTGRLPFSGESAVSIALKHLQSETPSLKRWNPQIPQSVENIVLKATAKDPFHRYDNVDEMEDDLRTALDSKRLNEGKFVIPEDDEATKAIPIITNDRPYHNLDETIIRKDAPASQESNGKPEKKKKKKWPIIMTVLFLLILTAGIVMVTMGPEIFGPKEKEVPDVSSMEVEDAVAELMSEGFIIGDRKEISDDEVEEGNVIRTNPKAGKMIKEGNEIDLYISTGKEKVELSDYTGRNYDDVRKLLEGKGFKDIIKTEEHADSEAGTILEQNPSGGESVIPEETTLEFKVSKGPELVTLRDLKGYNQGNLDVYEETTGLVIERSEAFHDTIQAGSVISQKPEAGTQLPPGSKVSVVISQGKKLVPQEVTKEIIIQYDPQEEGVPQEVKIYISDMNRDESVPAETFKITEDTTRKLTFMIAPGQEAYYKVTVDDTPYTEAGVPYPED